jgi:hypothetical protein
VCTYIKIIYIYKEREREGREEQGKRWREGERERG